MSELLDMWMELAEPNLSPTTARECRRLVDRRIRPALGKVAVRRLETSMLDQVHSILRRALKQGVKWSWISSNPAVNATPPRSRRTDVRPPNVAEIRLLLSAAAEKKVFGLALRIAASTGMRRGEICGLKWSNVDVRNRTLRVDGALVTVPGGVIEKDTKTHQARRISLDSFTLDALRIHRKQAEERAAAVGVEASAINDRFVLSYSADCATPVHPDSLTGAFTRLRVRLGFEGFRFHDLRHAHATELLAAGVPVKSVSSRLGHADASTTLNVYAHALESTDRQAADLAGKLFG